MHDTDIIMETCINGEIFHACAICLESNINTNTYGETKMSKTEWIGELTKKDFCAIFHHGGARIQINDTNYNYIFGDARKRMADMKFCQLYVRASYECTVHAHTHTHASTHI